jgi:hypothetical protein
VAAMNTTVTAPGPALADTTRKIAVSSSLPNPSNPSLVPISRDAVNTTNSSSPIPEGDIHFADIISTQQLESSTLRRQGMNSTW